MKESNKTETTVIIVFVIILIIIIGLVVFTAQTSRSNLRGNTNENNANVSQSQQPRNNTNANNNTSPNTNSTANPEITNNEETTNVVEEVKPPIETEIAYFSTNIYDKDENRVHNITHANSKLTETVIKKGEVFSFNDTIGSMHEAQGFKEAIGFDTNGKKIPMFGGGICQISSTLYNAALIANLEIVERHPHSRRVYYVPKDKDATIYYGHLDLKFKNTTDGDIKIISTNDDTNVTIFLKKITYES